MQGEDDMCYKDGPLFLGVCVQDNSFAEAAFPLFTQRSLEQCCPHVVFCVLFCNARIVEDEISRRSSTSNAKRTVQYLFEDLFLPQRKGVSLTLTFRSIHHVTDSREKNKRAVFTKQKSVLFVESANLIPISPFRSIFSLVSLFPRNSTDSAAGKEADIRGCSVPFLLIKVC
ncbi:hypothetical protein CEXT_699361 [Caerostris extrusa]|uniref:Uncharacterized protein n=1 Tax=Caerostris extrusa TaxID=172846 RepID=A0AAV4W5I6_CAEEX|nr:hypothetical protein CEXT_699361 [Caerostris extrusa]